MPGHYGKKGSMKKGKAGSKKARGAQQLSPSQKKLPADLRKKIMESKKKKR